MVEYITIKLRKKFAEEYIEPFIDRTLRQSRADVIRKALVEASRGKEDNKNE